MTLIVKDLQPPYEFWGIITGAKLLEANWTWEGLLFRESAATLEVCIISVIIH
jgi:hypothetical protein